MDYPAQTPQQLAQVLRGFRGRKKLTQSETARNAGLLQKTVSTLEVRPERASVESLFRLLSALQVEFVLRDKNAAAESSSPTQW